MADNHYESGEQNPWKKATRAERTAKIFNQRFKLI